MVFPMRYSARRARINLWGIHEKYHTTGAVGRGAARRGYTHAAGSCR